MFYDIISFMNKNIKSVTIAGMIIVLIIVGNGLFFYYKDGNPTPLSSSDPIPSILQGVITNGIHISQGTQGQFENLLIGLGNNKVGNYLDDNGVKKHGNTARLWISTPNDNTQNRTLDVYMGQSFVVDKYLIFVDQITIGHNLLVFGKTGGQGGSISLLIWEPIK